MLIRMRLFEQALLFILAVIFMVSVPHQPVFTFELVIELVALAFAPVAGLAITIARVRSGELSGRVRWCFTALWAGFAALFVVYPLAGWLVGPAYRTVLSATAAGVAALGILAGAAGLVLLARTDVLMQEPSARGGAGLESGGS